MKIDPSGVLLNSFIELNNLALSRFSEQERSRIGVHTCPGSDRDSTHSADLDYAEPLPSLFELQAGNFYVALAGEPDRMRVLKIIRQFLKPGQRIFIGVVSPIDPRVEEPEEIRDRREFADRLGRADLPGRVHVVLGADQCPVGHREQPDRGIIRRRIRTFPLARDRARWRSRLESVLRDLHG